jgi:hypothetical protein
MHPLSWRFRKILTRLMLQGTWGNYEFAAAIANLTCGVGVQSGKKNDSSRICDALSSSRT